MKQRRERGKASSAGLVFRLLMFCHLVLLAGLFHPPPAAAEKDNYTFAVVPQFPPAVIRRDWGPLVARLSQDTGLKLELKYYKSIPDFEQDVLEGDPDFVYLNPYHEVMAKKAHGYIPLIRDSEDLLIGILVVDKDSDFKSVKDLNGKMLVFPSPNAFAASLYMRALLSKQEKIRFTAKYVLTHSNVYQHVISGMAAAGGGVNKTLDNQPRGLKDELRVIYRTPPVAPHPIAANPRVPLSVRQAVINALLRLVDDQTSRHLLRAVGISRPVRADYARDYEAIERLDLEKYAVKGGD